MFNLLVELIFSNIWPIKPRGLTPQRPFGASGRPQQKTLKILEELCGTNYSIKSVSAYETIQTKNFSDIYERAFQKINYTR